MSVLFGTFRVALQRPLFIAVLFDQWMPARLVAALLGREELSPHPGGAGL